MAWSPDNLKILVQRPSGLDVLDLAGHDQPIPDTAGAGTQYYDGDNTMFSYGIRWSPDGTLIAFNRGATQVLVRPDGSSRSTRTGFLTGSWSPDGSSMLGSQPDPDTGGPAGRDHRCPNPTGCLSEQFCLGRRLLAGRRTVDCEVRSISSGATSSLGLAG